MPAPAIVDSALFNAHRHNFVRIARVLAWGIEDPIMVTLSLA